MTPIPERTVERLCIYRRILFRWRQQSKQRFHSHELAEEASITSAQVRRDMMSLKTIGTPKNGYFTDNIIEELGLIIEGEGGQKVVLVGLGKLGGAIVSYLDGLRPDLRIIAAFDIDPAKVETTFDYTPCLPIERVTEVVQVEKVLIAVLAVPSQVAQEIATELVGAGICAFVNCTSVKLKVPANVFVQDFDISVALEKSAYFARTLAEEAALRDVTPTEIADTTAEKRPRVLCIDDDRDVIDSYRAILNSAGYDVEFAFEGKSGLALARTCSPDLIILDVMMSHPKEGFGVAQQLRLEANLRFVPILMLTAVSSEAGFDKARDGTALPVDAFVDKPVAPFTLLSTMRRLLSLSRDQINVAGGIPFSRLPSRSFVE